MQAPSTTLVLRASSSFSVQARELGRARVQLPLVLAELLDDLLDALDVVVVGEVGAEGAAAVVRAVGVDALAAAAEDAGPARRQPGQVAAEPLPGVGGIGELHPDAGGVERGLRHVRHPTSRLAPPRGWPVCRSVAGGATAPVRARTRSTTAASQLSRVRSWKASPNRTGGRRRDRWGRRSRPSMVRPSGTSSRAGTASRPQAPARTARPGQHQQDRDRHQCREGDHAGLDVLVAGRRVPEERGRVDRGGEDRPGDQAPAEQHHERGDRPDRPAFGDGRGRFAWRCHSGVRKRPRG